MSTIVLGRTGLSVERTAFGALPIQRISDETAVALVRRAVAGGMNFIDTARSYTDSEHKLGLAFGGAWEGITLATKTHAQNAETFWLHLETSLKELKRDCIDIYQFHNPAFCPKPGGADGLYDAALEAKRQGKIRFIGITNHRLSVAKEAIASGLYDTLQFPFSYLSTEKELELVQMCGEANMGFIAMKALSGGLITHADAASAWLARYENVVPIGGIQRDWELDQFLAHIPNAPVLTKEMLQIIEADRAVLQGEFCRGCGYCMPCPQGIEINTCARASLLLRRSPSESLLCEEGRQKMARIELCTSCGACAAKCPYGLDTPALLQRNYQDYREVLAGKPL